MKLWRLAVLFVAVPLALFAGLVAASARSDFIMRGCSDMARDTWDATANCADGWFGQWFFASVSMACLGIIGLIIFTGLRA